MKYLIILLFSFVLFADESTTQATESTQTTVETSTVQTENSEKMIDKLTSTGDKVLNSTITKPVNFSIGMTLTQILDISIQTLDFENDYDKISKLIEKYKAVVVSTNQNQYSRSKNSRISLWFTEENFKNFQKDLKEIGSVESQNLTTQNNKNQNELLQMELDYVVLKKQTYEKEFAKMEANNQNYLNFWQTIQNFNDRIFEIKKSIKLNNQQNTYYTVNLNLYEYHSEPLDSFEFINMPGIEYNHLIIDTPEKELSSEKYHGVAIKYMFSKGKSYIVLDVLKTIDNVENETQIKEIFTYGYGADFYPKHLGAGRRMFLNPYSGFTLGGSYFTSEKDSIHTFYLTAHLGLELIKTRYLIMDIKGGYFLPFSHNRNFRGYLLTGSMNFMF